MNLVSYRIVVKELSSELSQGEYQIVFWLISNNWLNEEYFFFVKSINIYRGQYRFLSAVNYFSLRSYIVQREEKMKLNLE